MDEYFDVLDEHGRKTGRTKLRSAVHRDGDWHRGVDIILINKQGEVLLQQRCATKDSWPGYWDVSCGGHIVAGEDVMTTVFRELEEELGFKMAPTDLLLYAGSRKSSSRPAPDFINNAFQESFVLFADRQLSDLTFQTSEISALKFVPLTEFREIVEHGSSDPVVPHPDLYGRFLEIIDSIPPNTIFK